MPSKRRTSAKTAVPAPVKSASTSSKAIPPISKPPSPPLPQPPPPPTPPQPIQPSASKVRGEWQRFITDWYEPQHRKLKDQVHKDLAAKHRKAGSSKAQQKVKESELQEKLSQLAAQLAEPARTEWEGRLEAAHLREDQWDDMTCDEQQAVLCIFVGFFGDDDDEDVDQPRDDAQPSALASPDEVESTVEDQFKCSVPLSVSKQSPSMPNNVTFEFVNPTSLFDETTSPPNPPKKLPSLSMDHLATLGPSNISRQPEPLLTNGGGLGFQNWASEVGFAAQQLPSQAFVSTSQTLAPRPRATENISRQASAISSMSSPALFANRSSPPQSSPPIQTAKASPQAASEVLPLGKRYIGPVIFDDEEPLDDDLLKSKMAAEFEEFKNSLRIQMIYDFHAEAAKIEIKLVETLLTDEGTKESRAKAVQEHEMHMMTLRERKEGVRKKLCAEERERRREQHRIYLAQAAFRSAQNREADSSGPKGAPSKSSDPSGPQWLPSVSQKENIPVHPLTASISVTKPEPPSAMKKSTSVLSQVQASSNEAIFAEAAVLLAQGKLSTNGHDTPQLPQARRRTNSVHLPKNEIPQNTVNFADALAPASAPAMPTSAKGKKAKKAQATSKPVSIAEEPDIDTEPPPSAFSWDAPRTKGAWGTPALKGAIVSEDAGPTFASSLTPDWAGGNKKTNESSEKKAKTVTFTDGPDTEIAPPSTSLWEMPDNPRSSVNDKPTKKTGRAAQREQADPVPVQSSSSSRQKSGQASVASTNRKSRATAVSEESEDKEDVWSPVAPSPFSAQQTEAKTAWSTWLPKQTKPGMVQAGPEPRRGVELPTSKFARVEAIIDSDDEWPQAGANANLPSAEAPLSEESEEDDDWLDKENAEYWNNFIGVTPEPPMSESSAASAKHALWMPSVDPDNDDDDSSEYEDGLAGELWMQYAISGGELPGLAMPAPEVARAQVTQQETSAWGYEKTKQRNGGPTHKAASMLDRAVPQGAPWPKMENRLSSASRVGQNSSSTRFL